MAITTYTAVYSVHKTLSGTTAQKVVLTWRSNKISVVNRDSTNPLYVRIGDTTGFQVSNSGMNGIASVDGFPIVAANEGDDTHIVMPGKVAIFDMPASGSLTLAGNGNKYSVLATELTYG